MLQLSNSIGHGEVSVTPMTSDEPEPPKRRQRRVMGLADFTDVEIAAIESSEAPTEAAAFDHECDDRS